MLSLPSIGRSEAHGVAEPRLEGPRALSLHTKDSSPSTRTHPTSKVKFQDWASC